MQKNIEELTVELISLSKRERLELARLILFLDNRSMNSNDIDSTWEKEIADRVHAVDTGMARGVDYDNVVREIESRFAS